MSVLRSGLVWVTRSKNSALHAGLLCPMAANTGCTTLDPVLLRVTQTRLGLHYAGPSFFEVHSTQLTHKYCIHWLANILQ